jgi:hypothetical protein
MVNCCVNSACGAEHKLLRIGDVYAVEAPHVEHGARGVPLQRALRASVNPANQYAGDRGPHAHGAHI